MAVTIQFLWYSGSNKLSRCTCGVSNIDYMRTRFIRALAVTICAILAIKYFARIDACRARIVSVIPHIVSICLPIVRPKLADTNFGRSLSHWRPFLVLFLCHNGPIGIFEKVVRRWGSPFAHWHSDRSAPFLKWWFPFAHWHSGTTARLRNGSPKITTWAEALFNFSNFGLNRLLAHQPWEISFQH